MRKVLLSSFALILLLTSIAGFASCSKVEFKVDFVVDGEVYASVNTNGEETIKIPQTPTKEGYIFDGWYWDKDTWQKPFTANSLLDAPLSSDMSVYAKWKDKIHIHTPVIDEAIEPTDTKNGLTEGSHCSECGVVIIPQENIPALIQGSAIKSATLKVEDDKVSGVFSNETEIFSFIDDISIAKGATYIVARDIYCENTIHSKTVQLEEGDNIFYLLVTNSESMKLYTVTLRRRPIYIVSFDSRGGTFVENQLIEEGSFVEIPTISRTGYTLFDWDYDFSKPIMKNETITANWNANTDTSYKVEYYLQNIDNTYPDIPEQTLNLLGITDTTVIAEQKEFEHFTLNEEKSILSGNVDGDGSLVLQVYYSRNAYTINTSKNNDRGGSITSSSIYKFGDRITIAATTNPGYTFDGWFYEETLVCKNETYTFDVSQDSTYIAKWTANSDTHYKIEYYLQNYENDSYPSAPELTLSLTGMTDSPVYAEQKTFEHFTIDTNKSILCDSIKGDGSLVLKVYYSRDSYAITIANGDYGTIIDGVSSYKYGQTVTKTAQAEPWGVFLGWYIGDSLVSTSATYTFVIEQDLYAKFSENPQLSNFNYDFNVNSKTCNIISVKDKTITEIVIPDYVTSIACGALSGCSYLKEITIPFVGRDSISKKASASTLFGYIFGKEEYANSQYTSQVIIEPSNSGFPNVMHYGYYLPRTLDSVTVSCGNILPYAFSECSGIKNITIGRSVQYIGDTPSSVENVYIEDITAWCNIKFGDVNSNPLRYADNLYLNNELVTELIIPDGVTNINEHAFHGYGKIISVTISSSVNSIGESAFQGCHIMEIINLSSLDIEIASTNHGMIASQAIEVHNGASKIIKVDDFAFYSYNDINYLIDYSGVESQLILPENFNGEKYIVGRYAFDYCDNLKNVIISKGVTSIEEFAFYACKNLQTVVICSEVESIGDHAYAFCESLSSITLGSDIKNIGDSAFYDCNSLKYVYFAGDENDWLNIIIGRENEELTNAYRYYSE